MPSQGASQAHRGENCKAAGTHRGPAAQSGITPGSPGLSLPAADPTALLQGGTRGASKNNNNNKINKIKIKIKNKVQDSISGSEKRS